VISDEGAHAPTPRCCYIAVFRRQRPTEPSARSRSRLRERPWGARARARLREAIQPAPRADSPGASGQRDMPARVRPDVRVRVQRDCRRERAPRCGARQLRRHKALEREKPARGATDGDTRWRRGHIHFSPERARAVRRAPARPNGRSRATRRAAAASGAGRRDPPSNHSRRLVTQPTSWWTQKGRGRLGRPRPRKHRRHEARSGGRGTSSGRGLSKSYAYGSVFSSLRTCVATVPIRTPSSAATS